MDMLKLLGFRKNPEKVLSRTASYINSPENKTKIFMRLDGVTKNAFSGLNLGVQDYLVHTSIDTLLKNAESRALEGVTALSFFDTSRMKDEVEIAKERDVSPQETIAGARGAWAFRVAIEPTDEIQAINAVESGLATASQKNLTGLAEIYEAHKSEIPYDFKERNDPKNIMHWRNLVASYKAPNGSSHKDWDQVIDFDDGSGSPIIRQRVDTIKKERYFDYEVVDYGSDEGDRKLEDMINNKNVAKVVMFKNKEGRIDRLEIWYGHFFNDEPGGRDVMNSIFDAGLNEDVNIDLTGVNINRKRVVFDNEGNPFLSIDVDNSFKLSNSEKDFHNNAQDIIHMNQSVYFAAAYLLLNSKLRSSYLCINPNTSSALQLSIVTKPEVLDRLMGIVRDEGLLGKPENLYKIQMMDKFKAIANGLVAQMEQLALYQRGEIKEGQDGYGLVNLLGVYTPKESQEMLSSIFGSHAEIIAKGALQISKVVHKDNKVKNATFVTAQSVDSSAVIGVKSGDTGTVVDVRMTSDQQLYNRFAELVKGSTVNQGDFDEFVKKTIKENTVEYRKVMAILSYLIQAVAIDKNQTIVTDTLRNKLKHKIYSEFLSVLGDIDNSGEKVS